MHGNFPGCPGDSFYEDSGISLPFLSLFLDYFLAFNTVGPTWGRAVRGSLCDD